MNALTDKHYSECERTLNEAYEVINALGGAPADAIDKVEQHSLGVILEAITAHANLLNETRQMRDQK